MRFIMLVLLAGFSFYSFAEDAAVDAQVAETDAIAPLIWKAEAELGMVFTSGNSETDTTNGRFNATRELNKWRHNILLEAFKSSNTDVATGVEATTAERYASNLKADYKVSAADFLFANGNYNDDRFSGFSYQATLSVGYGRHLLQTEKQTLEAEIGPGIRFFKLKPDPVSGARIASDDEGILHLSASYVYNFTERSAFLQDVIVDIGDDATISQSVTGVRAQIINKLAMKVTARIRSSSQVPAATKKTDRENALTLIYTF